MSEQNERLPAITTASGWWAAPWLHDNHGSAPNRPMTLSDLAALVRALPDEQRWHLLKPEILRGYKELTARVADLDQIRSALCNLADVETDTGETTLEIVGLVERDREFAKNRIAELERENAELTTALRNIENLVDTEFCHDLNARCHASELPPAMTADEIHAVERILMKIYGWTHGLNKEHSCHHVHEDWRAEATRPAAPSPEKGGQHG